LDLTVLLLIVLICMPLRTRYVTGSIPIEGLLASLTYRITAMYDLLKGTPTMRVHDSQQVHHSVRMTVLTCLLYKVSAGNQLKAYTRKFFALTDNARNALAPSYLAGLLNEFVPVRVPRTSDTPN